MIELRNVEYFPYRTAKIDFETCFMVIDREHAQSLENALAKELNQMPDNHSCYRFIDNHGNTICVWFSDFKAYFGRNLIVYNEGKI